MGLNPDVLEESEEGDEGGAPAWMATFSDLSTLLLTFFVLLLSFANMDANQFRDALGSVRDAFGVTHIDPGRFEARATTIVEVGNAGGRTVWKESSALKAVKDAVARRGLGGLVDVSAGKRGIVIRMRDRVLFDVASDKIVEEGVPVLKKVAELTNEFKGPVAIEGHSDNRPIHSVKFPSNWELSAFRATSVLRYLIDNGVEKKRLTIAGCGDTHPISDNDTAEGRAKNRRVEFIFSYDGLEVAATGKKLTK